MKTTIIIDDINLLKEIKKYAERSGLKWQAGLAKILAVGVTRAKATHRYSTSKKGKATQARHLARVAARAAVERQRREAVARKKGRAEELRKRKKP